MRWVLSLYARGLITGKISSHFADIYGAAEPKNTISRITDEVIEEMGAWHTCPLERVRAAVFIGDIGVLSNIERANAGLGSNT